jgi:hypothetical protein
MIEPSKPEIVITPPGSKATVAIWSYLDKFIISGHENGSVTLWDPIVGLSLLKEVDSSEVVLDRMEKRSNRIQKSTKDLLRICKRIQTGRMS